MKSSGKKTRHKLQLSEDTGILFLGLATPEPDYKVSLALNSILKTRFKGNRSITVNHGTDLECSFSRFSSRTEYNDSSFELVSVRNGACILDKKLAGLDYLLIVRGDDMPSFKETIIPGIREAGEFTAVFVLDDFISAADSILIQIA
ncbi:MAG: hypothetical protein R2744_01350 [Bacteroidales bacterium]